MIHTTTVVLIVLGLCNGFSLFTRDCFRPNESYSCGTACQRHCRTLNETCKIYTIRCVDNCYCNRDYARDQTGSCVPIEHCEDRLQGICGENEEYRLDHILNNECHAQNWSQYVRLNSTMGCFCIEGYLKDSDGVCVPVEQCSPMPESSTIRSPFE